MSDNNAGPDREYGELPILKAPPPGREVEGPTPIPIVPGPTPPPKVPPPAPPKNDD
jgi:hypothetical protein